MKQRLLLIFLLLSAGQAFSQNTITGIIRDSKGATIPHATILIRGTKISVSADNNGAFSIQPKQEPPFYLQVSSVGFKAQDFQILKLQDTLELVLVEDALLAEIVVTSRRRSESLQAVPFQFQWLEVPRSNNQAHSMSTALKN